MPVLLKYLQLFGSPVGQTDYVVVKGAVEGYMPRLNLLVQHFLLDLTAKEKISLKNASPCVRRLLIEHVCEHI